MADGVKYLCQYRWAWALSSEQAVPKSWFTVHAKTNARKALKWLEEHPDSHDTEYRILWKCDDVEFLLARGKAYDQQTKWRPIPRHPGPAVVPTLGPVEPESLKHWADSPEAKTVEPREFPPKTAVWLPDWKP